MSTQQDVIDDPHLGDLLRMALARAASLANDAEEHVSANCMAMHAKECAKTVMSYIRQLHEANNRCMTLQSKIDELTRPEQA